MKQLGIAIWLAALAFFVARSVEAPKTGANLAFVCAVLFVYLPLLIYSWLWGPQRGHVAHFTAIVVAAYFSILLYFGDSIPGVVVGIGICAGLVVLALVVRRYRAGFVSDFRKRIRRDHFARKG
jgi:hypothetical protein